MYIIYKQSPKYLKGLYDNINDTNKTRPLYVLDCNQYKVASYTEKQDQALQVGKSVAEKIVETNPDENLQILEISDELTLDKNIDNINLEEYL